MLIRFTPVFRHYTPEIVRRPGVFWRFRGHRNKNIGVEWVHSWRNLTDKNGHSRFKASEPDFIAAWKKIVTRNALNCSVAGVDTDAWLKE